MDYRLTRFLLVFVLFSASAPPLSAQIYPDSPVFRNFRPRKDTRIDPNEGLRKQINVFLLERDAANGDPLAQHELGVRYLKGVGVPADTVKSAEWLRLAASQGIISAMYNYALLLNNGWGVSWNPFDAYRLFLQAAEAGMPEAQHVVGVFYSDDLVLKQDWSRAWSWFVKADEAGFEPAARAKAEILRRGYIPPEDPASPGEMEQASVAVNKTVEEEENASDPLAWTPVLLDLKADTSTHEIDTRQLLAEFLASVPFTPDDSLLLRTLIEDDPAPSAMLRLQRMVEFANPQARVLYGRFYEEGRNVPVNLIRAAALYGSAVYLESARAAGLLIGLIRGKRLRERLPRAAYDGDPEAQYVWSILRGLDFDTRLSEAEALEMLERAASHGYTRAMIQLGILHVSGRWVDADAAGAATFWKEAARRGEEEGRIRLAAAALLGQASTMSIDDALTVLESAAEEGGIIAEVALAAGYEKGSGRSVNKGKAVGMYRDCAIRGSLTAFRALRRMHEELRPDAPAFRRSDI